uniref:Putative glutathione S-transferase n=1 Tax=uncultured bacterium CSLF43 TaxID=1091575 RepID=G4WW30_9BACT|nr:putative glutathione S-transferase [uncultured bacterium CSLF43]
MHTAPYFTAFGLLAILHALQVVRLRIKHKIHLGSGDNPELERMSRVFGNYVEYVPIGLVLLIALEVAQSPVWYLHLCGMTLLLGRIFHAIGLSQTELPNSLRRLGMILTLFSLFLASVGVTLWTIFEPASRS